MARRQLDALLGDQIDERIMRRGRGRVHRRHHALIGLRAGDRGDVREGVADLLGLGAHAAGDDDLAVLRHRRADRLERFLLGAVEKAAGVDDHRVGAGVALATVRSPRRASCVRMRSLSTSALGQPSETKEMRGAGLAECHGLAHGRSLATAGRLGKASLARRTSRKCAWSVPQFSLV